MPRVEAQGDLPRVEEEERTANDESVTYSDMAAAAAERREEKAKAVRRPAPVEETDPFHEDPLKDDPAVRAVDSDKWAAQQRARQKRFS